MKQRLNFLEVAPMLSKQCSVWESSSGNRSGLEKSLLDRSTSASLKSAAVLSVLICTRRICERLAKPNSASICWKRGVIRLCYTERERAALAFAEAATVLKDKDVPDEVYEQARAQFSEQELVNLTLAVVAINGWNRLNIAFPQRQGLINRDSRLQLGRSKKLLG